MNKKLLIVGLAAAAVMSLSACGNTGKKGYYTYNTYTAVSPSNWNELTYQDSNDTQIMSYISGSFFTFNYKFDASGKIIDGDFSIEYDGAKLLEDVTETYAGDENYSVPEGKESGYAYAITLRDDLKWDDGTPIHAEDFVYTMQEQLNPLFFNYRADSYYNGATVIHNARNYLYGGSHGYASPMISADYGDDEYVPMDQFKTRETAPEGQGKWGFEEEKADGTKEFHDVQLDFASTGNWGSNPAAQYFWNYCTAANPEMTDDNKIRVDTYNSNMDRWMLRPVVTLYAVPVVDDSGSITGWSEFYASDKTTKLAYDAEKGEIKDASGALVANAANVKVFYPANDDYNALLSAVNALGEGKDKGKATKLIIDQNTIVNLQNLIAQLHGNADLAAYEAKDPSGYPAIEWQEMVFLGSDFPVIGFDKVGLFADKDNPNKLIVVLDNPLELLEADGKTLAYKAAYNFASLPLVKRDLYEKNKVEPKEGSKLWTTTYNSSLESTASWGPYKLTKFQSGKQYILERNPNWYGYNMDEYKGQYQTDRIVCDTIEQWNTAWLAFQKGNIAQIGIDPSIASDYVNSSRAVFTADDYVGSLQLQSDADALKGREEAGIDKEILSYADFRKAISLSINRDDYCASCTTASKAGFGLFNSMHYYDVAHAGIYRNEDVAKQVLCEVYGVDVSKYASLDEAYAAVNGFNPEMAKVLVTSAYEQAKADGKIADGDKVQLVYGTSADTEATRRSFDYLDKAFKEMCKGTALEGRIELKFDSSFGSTWAEDFRGGAYDICAGGWSGAAWDPGYFLLAYLDSNYMYSAAWDTEAETLAYDPDGDGEEYEELEMSLMDWYNCLNGVSGAAKNFAEGQVDNDIRLGIIAQLEKAILLKYYTVPLYNYYSAQLRSYKIEYGSNTYNTFMGYGGIRYIRYNYDDYDWNRVKAKQDYKK